MNYVMCFFFCKISLPKGFLVCNVVMIVVHEMNYVICFLLFAVSLPKIIFVYYALSINVIISFDLIIFIMIPGFIF